MYSNSSLSTNPSLASVAGGSQEADAGKQKVDEIYREVLQMINE